jgi:peptidyl-prolyl cis-trans isomerase B (cyclophilin B)
MQMVAVALTMILLNPVRLYFQPNQPIPVQFNAQGLSKLHQSADTPLQLALLTPAGKVQQKVAIDPNKTTLDLMELFPAQGRQSSILWNGSTWYLQLVAGENQPIGSPLVVVPLVPPSQRGQATPSALRIYPEKLVVFDTTAGTIGIRLDPAAAPNTTMQFSNLVTGGFYTNVIFHRVIPQFVIQGGDPTGSGTGGPGFFIDLESSSKAHTRGTVSMARQGNDINSSGSQFFICLSRQAVASLDRQYTAFGDVVWGMDAVDRIVALPTSSDGANRPLNPPVIKKAVLVAAPPRPLDAPAPTEVPAMSAQALEESLTSETQRRAQEAEQLGKEALELLGGKK